MLIRHVYWKIFGYTLHARPVQHGAIIVFVKVYAILIKVKPFSNIPQVD